MTFNLTEPFMKRLFFLLGLVFPTLSIFAQIPETEPNNNFATSQAFNRFDDVAATIANGNDDYYRLIMPFDGTVQIYVTATNTGASNGWIYGNIYDARQTNFAIQNWNIANSQNSFMTPNETRTDTILLEGRQADTLYIRYYSSTNFNYNFSYNVINPGDFDNDVEPNGSFATALPIAKDETKQGRLEYIKTGTSDEYDYYCAILPHDGTVKIKATIQNATSLGNWVYMNIYDSRQANIPITNFNIANSQNSLLSAFETRTDSFSMYSRAADTFYFRLYASRASQYALTYTYTDTSENDVEPNGSFATAIPLAINQSKKGHTEYIKHGVTDDYDYYRIIMPTDGTLKVKASGKNMSNNNAWIYMNIYDSRQANIPIANFNIGNSQNTFMLPLESRTDSILLHARMADTMYFRIYSSHAMQYEVEYSIETSPLNDIEPNGSFATAIYINPNETKSGKLKYMFRGNADDYDYYTTVLPQDGTLELSAQGTNVSTGNGWIYMNIYDGRQTNIPILNFNIGNSQNTLILPSETRTGTIKFYGVAGDTMYFRIHSSHAMDYSFSYRMIDTSANDVEPNSTFSTALPMDAPNVAYPGHIEYRYRGTNDDNDYYRTIFTTNDTLRIYANFKNISSGNGWARLNLFDKNQSQILQKYIANSNNSLIQSFNSKSDSIILPVTAPDTIYTRVNSSIAMQYSLTLDGRLPLSNFTLAGANDTCIGTQTYHAVGAGDTAITYHWSRTSGLPISFTDSTASVNWTTPITDTIVFYTSNSLGNSYPQYFPVTIHEDLSSLAPVVTADGRNLSSNAKPDDSHYQWYKNNVALVGDTLQTYFADSAGNFTVKFENKCGASNPSNTISFANDLQSQTITLTPTADQVYDVAGIPLTASASSSLPVTLEIVSGLANIVNDTMFLTSAGTIIIKASQAGNVDYSPAPDVYDTILISQGSQTITFNPITDKIVSDVAFALDATSSANLPITYTILSGNATISGNVLNIIGAGTITVRASQAGNPAVAPATSVDQSFCVGIRNLNAITGPTNVCTNAFTYNTNSIPGANYTWTANNGAVLAPNGNSAMVSFNTAGSYILTVKANSNCDTTYSTIRTLNVNAQVTVTPDTVTSMAPANNATAIDVPFTLSWIPVNNAVNYDVYLWPTSLSPSTVPYANNTTNFNIAVAGNVADSTNYSWRVVANGVCASTTSATQNFDIENNGLLKPDLQLESITVPASATQGQNITITWTVKNVGATTTGPTSWKDRIRLSIANDLKGHNTTLEPLLAEYNNLTYLLPGQSYTQTKTIQIPQGITGNYFVFVTTDMKSASCGNSAVCNVFWGPRGVDIGNVRESNEYNNYRYQNIVFNYGSLPDIKVKSIAAPITSFSNDSINVTYATKNQGVADAYGKQFGDCPQRTWFDNIYISPSPIFSNIDAVQIGTNQVSFYQNGEANCQSDSLPYKDFIEPDSTILRTARVKIPHYISGTQYVHVISDINEDIFEGPFTSNNRAVSDSIQVVLTPPADLIVSNVQTPGSQLSGTSFGVSYTVTNQGINPQVERRWHDSIFICSTPTLNYDSVIYSGANPTFPVLLGNNASYNGSFNVHLPNAVSGNYYVFVKTDARFQVFEFNQDFNNEGRSANSFLINLAPAVDAVVRNITHVDTITAGQNFDINYFIKNIGVGTLTYSLMRDKVSISTDSSMNGAKTDIPAFNLYAATIPANDSSANTINLKIDKSLAGFSYYVFVETDPSNGIYELNGETNNMTRSVTKLFVKNPPMQPIVTGKSDLEILTSNIPSSVEAGRQATITYTVKNSGSVATTKAIWLDRIYLSTDTIISNDDVELKESYKNYTQYGLLKDSSYNYSTDIKIPLRTAPGNYYVLLAIDQSGTNTNDSIRANNFERAPITITPTTLPNLAISNVSGIPAILYGGQQFTVHYTLTNLGSDSLHNGSPSAIPYFHNKAFFSTSSNNKKAPTAGSQTRSYDLAPSASLQDSIQVTIPVYAQGFINFYIKIDNNDHIFENYLEADNIDSTFVSILPAASAPPSDLIVTQINAPSTATIGEENTTQFVVKNVGANPAVGLLNNALFLSQNNTYENAFDKYAAAKSIPLTSLGIGDSIITEFNSRGIPNVEGSFYHIARTNTTASISEPGLAIANNDLTASTPTQYSATNIPLNTLVPDTLETSYPGYYKINTPIVQDLKITMSTTYTGTGANQLYVKKDSIPNLNKSDYSSISTTELNPICLIPNAAIGDHYLQVVAANTSTTQNITLIVEPIPFSIIQVSPNVVGNDIVSTKIYGGGLDPNAVVELKQGSTILATAEITEFTNSTEMLVKWNLTGVTSGMYDVWVTNPGNNSTFKSNALEVQTSTGYQVAYLPIHPELVREFHQGSNTAFTYQITNTGNIDIPVMQGEILVPATTTITGVQMSNNIIPNGQVSLDNGVPGKATRWHDADNFKGISYLVQDFAPGKQAQVTFFANDFPRNTFPIESKLYGYSHEMFIRAIADHSETFRLSLLQDSSAFSGLPIADMYANAQLGSQAFIQSIFNTLIKYKVITASEIAKVTLPYNCSECLRGFDSTANLAYYDFRTGRETGADTIAGNLTVTNASPPRMQVKMNRSTYWNGYGGTVGIPGGKKGWDQYCINGILDLQNNAANPIEIDLYGLNYLFAGGQVGGWAPAFSHVYTIIKTTGGILNFSPDKFIINATHFAKNNPMYGGYFSVVQNGNNIDLVFTAYQPGLGENGVPGVCGVPGFYCDEDGEPGSPGGPGGPGNATIPAGCGGWGGCGGCAHPCGTGNGGWGGCGGIGGANPFGIAGCGGFGGYGGCSGFEGGIGGNGGCGGNGGSGLVGGAGGDGGNGIISSGQQSGQQIVGTTGGQSVPTGGPGGLGGIGGGGIPLVDPCEQTKKGPQDQLYKDILKQQQLREHFSSFKGILNVVDGGVQNFIEKNPDGGFVAKVGGRFIQTVVRDLKDGGVPFIGPGAAKEFMETAVIGTAVSYVRPFGEFYIEKNYPFSGDVKDLLEEHDPQVSSEVMAMYDEDALDNMTLDLVDVEFACDPNEIIGQVGYGEQSMVSNKKPLAYTIHFENDSSLATIAAQKVLIEQDLHPNFDPTTLELGSFGFANRTFQVPSGLKTYATTLDLKDSLGYNIDVAMGYNIANNKLFWLFNTIDPHTGLAPANPLLGLLPVNDFTGQGEGSVSYSIKPKANTVTGDSLSATANIIFDINAPVITNTWENIIDAFKPTNSMGPFTNALQDSVINLHFSGLDESNGSGLKSYDWLYTDNGGPLTTYATDMISLDTTFIATDTGHTYCFYARSRDNVLNETDTTLLNCFTFNVSTPLPINGIKLSGTRADGGIKLDWNVLNETEVQTYELQKETTNNVFETISTTTVSNGSNAPAYYDYLDRDIQNETSHLYRVKQTFTDNRSKFSNTVVVRTPADDYVKLYPNPVQDFLEISGIVGKGTVRIISLPGIEVMKVKIDNQQSLKLDCRSLPRGVYIIKLGTDEQQYVQKISKE